MLVGIDVLDVVRMEKFVQNEHNLEKFFTTYEINYVSQTNRLTQSLAGLFAAKEAYLKAIGIGVGGGINFNELEINHTSSGKPYIKIVSPKAQIMLTTMGIGQAEISISHADEYCTAVCLVEKNNDKEKPSN